MGVKVEVVGSICNPNHFVSEWWKKSREKKPQKRGSEKKSSWNLMMSCIS